MLLIFLITFLIEFLETFSTPPPPATHPALDGTIETLNGTIGTIEFVKRKKNIFWVLKNSMVPMVPCSVSMVPLVVPQWFQ